jgi:hypothetical protein
VHHSTAGALPSRHTAAISLRQHYLVGTLTGRNSVREYFHLEWIVGGDDASRMANYRNQAADHERDAMSSFAHANYPTVTELPGCVYAAKNPGPEGVYPATSRKDRLARDGLFFSAVPWIAGGGDNNRLRIADV